LNAQTGNRFAAGRESPPSTRALRPVSPEVQRGTSASSAGAACRLCAKDEAVCFALGRIVWMSLQPAIPRRVALLHCSPPLHRSVRHREPDGPELSTTASRGLGIFNRNFGEVFTSAIEKMFTMCPVQNIHYVSVLTAIRGGA
jgi:hypothetical protein